MRPRRSRVRPQPERTIHVHPRAGAVRLRHDLLCRIESAGVHVAGLDADDRVIVEWRQRIGAHASLIVHWHPHHTIASEAEQAKRFEHADVHFLADDDSDGWRAEETVLL